jgi:dTDP-4-amino-4,6-dideoxygalactose transaminase
MNVPFVDLKAQYLTIKPKIDAAIQAVIENTAFIGGKPVEAFEKAYAEKYGMKHCISCANGTDAIYITLKALGIGFGDEVITVANSWISTSETITQAGARPVFVDIDEYFHIDPAKIEARITKKTKAVIPVHIFGQPADIKAVRDICDRHKLHLIEDCAQSHFATVGGLKTGTFGIAGTFSFYPGRTSAPTATAGPSSPTTRTSPARPGSSPTTALSRSTSTRSRASTAASTASRPPSSRSSSTISTNGTRRVTATP